MANTEEHISEASHRGDRSAQRASRRRRRTGRRLGTAVALSGALLAGCSEEPPPPPIEIGQARASGRRITYPTAYDPSGHFAFDQWPQACSLLTAAELTSVLPQAANVRHERQDRDVRLLFSGREVTVKGAICAIAFDLPGLRGSISIAEEAAGIAVGRLPSSMRVPADDQTDVGGGCATGGLMVGAEVACQRGRIWFTLKVSLGYQNNKPSADENMIRFSADGTVTTFVSGRDEPRRWEFERRHVAAPLARLAAAKL